MSERTLRDRRPEWGWLVPLPLLFLVNLLLWNTTHAGCADTAFEGGESYCWSGPALGLEATWLVTVLSALAGMYCVYRTLRGSPSEG